MTKPAKRTKPKFTEIRPEYREGEAGRLVRHWRTMFLDSLAETSNVSESARLAGVNPRRVYKIRREEPEFARQWRDALIEGYEHLEMETLHRLRFGNQPDEPKFDIGSALRLLAMHKETIARERARTGAFSEADILASINAKIAAMRARERCAAYPEQDRLPSGARVAEVSDGS